MRPRIRVLLPFVCAVLFTARADVVFTEPKDLLFGGLGFQNAECQLLALMPDDFRDTRVLKSFLEIRPTFARVYTGFADAPQGQNDRFVAYYDATFRKVGTELYAVGGMMPFVPETETEDYAARVARNLAYLVKTRGCTLIRRYCMTNELGINDRGDWYVRHMDRFRALHAALRRAFDREGLTDVDLVATDVNNHVDFSLRQLDWATRNMDDLTGIYGTHWYMFMGRRKDGVVIRPDSPENAAVIENHFARLVAKAAEKGKRYFMGEFGLWTPSKQGPRKIMHDDTGFPLREPSLAAEGALTLAEIALAAVNSGAYAAASWSFCDYPDPFVFEDGDTPEDRAVYESARGVYWPDRKYNKWGLFRWDSVDLDYRAYPQLYTLGPLARFFHAGGRPLARTVDDPHLRVAGVRNPDGSVSWAVINWGAAQTLRIRSAHPADKPFRRYRYEAARVPDNPFNDLPPWVDSLSLQQGAVAVDLPAKSLTILTTDYVDRRPSEVSGIVRTDDGLRWEPVSDREHAYYRVYRNGRQIASTVATHLCVAASKNAVLAVTSVDRWGNEGMQKKNGETK